MVVNYRAEYAGRERDLAKFGKLLSSPIKKGVFLVTGYRGMGKTSFVNRAIMTYQHGLDNGRRVEVINLNLAQRDPSEADILKLMVSHLYELIPRISQEKQGFSKVLFKRGLLLAALILAFLLAINFSAYLIRILNSDGSKQIPITVAITTGLTNENTEKVKHQRFPYRSDDGRSFFTSSDLTNQFIPNINRLVENRGQLIGAGQKEPVQDILWLHWLIFADAFLIFALLGIHMYNSIKTEQPLSPEERLRDIYKRCYSTNSMETGRQQEISLDSIPIIAYFNELASPFQTKFRTVQQRDILFFC